MLGWGKHIIKDCTVFKLISDLHHYWLPFIEVGLCSCGFFVPTVSKISQEPLGNFYKTLRKFTIVRYMSKMDKPI